MSLTLNETFRVAAPPDRVWQFLKNPAEVVTCLPGAELTGTIDAQTYAGRVKVKVGPITAAYAGKATLAKVDDAERRMQIVAEGKESGGPGSARMTMTGHVTAQADGTSEVSVDAAIEIAGRVMQFGRGLIESVNKQLFKQFAESVRAKLEAAHASEVAEAAPAVVDVASPAAHDALGAPPETPPAASTAGTAGTESPVAARVPTPSTAPAVAHGEELRALPLLWKVFVSWLSGLFGKRS
ncbi:MAG: SRPBCC family protein [Gemmatimonadetes bacterium]|jgi:carbon monoxide dehydrogenase subunit G|nr:SRPBCC family protein [Gemmatimonadota bacterium]MBK7834505.1 SRPBCC family protein [Gemmatimonadota bacterium]